MGNLALIIYNIYMPIRSTIILVETRFKFANLYCHEKKNHQLFVYSSFWLSPYSI